MKSEERGVGIVWARLPAAAESPQCHWLQCDRSWFFSDGSFGVDGPDCWMVLLPLVTWRPVTFSHIILLSGQQGGAFSSPARGWCAQGRGPWARGCVRFPVAAVRTQIAGPGDQFPVQWVWVRAGYFASVTASQVTPLLPAWWPYFSYLANVETSGHPAGREGKEAP